MPKEKRASKKRSSWGCVQRVAQGKYRLRWMEDGVRRTETLHGTRREADDRMAEIRTRVGSGPSKRQVTVGEAYERYYWPHVRDTAVDNTRANTASIWRAHVSPRWAGAALRDVRPAELQEWLLSLTRSQATAALRVMRGVFREAALYELADPAPLAVCYRMPDRVSKPRSREVVAAADMERYWQAAKCSGLGAMFVLAEKPRVQVRVRLVKPVRHVAACRDLPLDAAQRQVVARLAPDCHGVPSLSLARDVRHGELRGRNSVSQLVVSNVHVFCVLDCRPGRHLCACPDVAD